jgi:hypothetical protein
MSSEIFGSCDLRELLWQSWVDARCMLNGAQGTLLQFARREEEATRNALNAHMVKHECGLPVAEPRTAIAAKAS